MNFIKILPGKFMMGSPESESGRFDDEIQKEVTIENEFEIMDAPVTQQEWIDVMDENPAYFKDNPNCPIEQVSWDDCQDFIRHLNDEGNEAIDKNYKYKYQLPTEAEWEYCCRAGTTTKYSFGDDENELKKYAWFRKNKAQPIKQKLPNAWGLYDMHGNVWEWTDSKDLESDTYRVFRGGSWFDSPQFLRSAYRHYYDPGVRYYVIGFRLLRTKVSLGPT